MRLKRLEVLGFKSFADSTAFGFEPGLTGIVGPNGCGKSNVVDAIKWVLGETRPTSLRGSEMEDVIFKGTAARPPLGLAEVTLVLDNSMERIPGPAEISLTRRFYRTGEGEYLLNRSDVRRKDLKQMLYGTGLGVNAYAILEQGKIDAVLSANAVDRRAIFEEAAGITRFRFDRREALRRLESTDKDLESVRAVLGELERQRNSLRLQASRARRHGELIEQLRGWRAAAALTRYHEKVEERAAAAAAVAEQQRLEARARSERARAAEDAERAREEARALQAEESQLSTELSSIRNEETRCVEREQAALSQSRELLESAARKRERAAVLGGERTPLEEERNRAAARLEESGRRVEAAEAELESRIAELRAANEEYRAAGRAVEESQRQLLQAIEGRTSAQNALADLDAEERAGRGEEERLRRKRNELAEELARLEPEKHTAESRHQQSARRLEELRAEEAKIRGTREQAETTLAETDGRLSEIHRRQSGIQSRLAVLRELDSTLAGVGAGAKALLQSGRLGILGLLADHARTELEYAPALEAALGRYAGAVLAATPDVAARALAEVKEKRGGRVAVVVAREGSAPEIPKNLPEGPGTVGPLLRFVRLEPRVARAVGELLAQVFVVETLEDAFRLVANYPQWTFVTRTGERVDAAGVTSGSVEAGATPIARRSAMEALEAENTGTRGEQQAQEALREKARVTLVQSRAEEDRWASAMGAATRDVQEHQVALSEATHRLQRLRSEHSLLSAETAEVESRLKDLAGRRVVLQESAASASAAVQKATIHSQDLQSQRQRTERARDESVVTESRARVAAAEAKGEQERLREELARREQTLERSRAEGERLATESSEEEARSSQLSGEAKDLRATLARLEASRAGLDARLESTRRSSRARVAAADEAVRAERSRTEELETVQGALGEARLAEQRAAFQCEEIATRAREEANVVIDEMSSVLVLDPAFTLAAADAKIAEIQAKLDRIGTVSSDATSELDSVETRFSDLDRQRIDLEQAKKTLQETIAELDKRCLERFAEAFASIRHHFGELFRRLFRGGKADILLQEGVDPLESGVEIFAQPPGKKLQTISLLSGGERTLTALALLFAAFKFKPSPFCVLDEVDAALDDANVERFLGMLEEFEATTQFIVVTHHRRTMSACSALLGVTMPERGVSQKVAVRLEDVDRVVPGAVGSVAPSSVASSSAAAPAAQPNTNGLQDVEVVPMPPRSVSASSVSASSVSASSVSASSVSASSISASSVGVAVTERENGNS